MSFVLRFGGFRSYVLLKIKFEFAALLSLFETAVFFFQCVCVCAKDGAVFWFLPFFDVFDI